MRRARLTECEAVHTSPKILDSRDFRNWHIADMPGTAEGRPLSDGFRIPDSGLRPDRRQPGPPAHVSNGSGKDINGSHDRAPWLVSHESGLERKPAGVRAGARFKAGDEYVRVATNVKKDDGSRAIGTILDPNGPVIAMIKKGEAYYGDATILGKPYVTGYDPIRDASGNVIGIYYVGYTK
jgi:Cache 3/Cache 2 fusion domain